MADPFELDDIALLLSALYARTEQPSTDLSRPWHVAAGPAGHFKSNERSGKWCIFRTRADIDDAWSCIKSAVAAGHLLQAKVSTALNRGNRPHVICVYTADYADTPAREAAREQLRALGFTEELGYKRDADTRAGIYGPDEWFARA